MARKIQISIDTAQGSWRLTDYESISGDIFHEYVGGIGSGFSYERGDGVTLLTNAAALARFRTPTGFTGFFRATDVEYVDIDGVSQVFTDLSDVVSIIAGYFFVTVGAPDIVWVDVTSKLPLAVGGIHYLEAGKTYYFTRDVDLLGNRMVGGQDTVILGASSENCSITSTGLGAGVPLFYSEWTTPIRDISFRDVDTAIEIDGSVNAPVALDWTGVNFVNVPNALLVNTCDNFIYTTGAMLNSRGMVFDGSIGTIGINNSLVNGGGVAGNIIEVKSTATITRRFRLIYSSVIASGASVGIDVDPAATIPTEGFILDTVSFSGGGSYLGGVDHTSNKSLFTSCTGITNTAVNGQLYMQNNAVATVVAAPSTFYKVLGTTTASSDNAKFDHSNNRLTCRATIQRKYLIQCTLSFTSGNGNVCEFGFYDSRLAAVRVPSRTKSTANAAGRAENVHFACVVNMKDLDYQEIHAANNSAATNITVDQMNFIITEIK
jgi:hypothetical protein